MKRIIYFTFCLFSSFLCHAQFNDTNSLIRNAFVIFQMDSQGFFQKENNKMLDRVDKVVSFYGYDKKTQNLYVRTETANCCITLTKDYAKIFKKNPQIPQIKPEQVNALVEENTKQLEASIMEYNIQRQKHLEDSVARVRAKERADSIEKARQDSIELAKKIEKRNNYIAAHPNWHWLPTNKAFMRCTQEDCSYSTSKDSIYCIKMTNDSIAVLDMEEGPLNEGYLKVHTFLIPNYLKKETCFQEHCAVYEDSLFNDMIIDKDFVELANTKFAFECYEKVEKIAPYGFFESWGWDDDFSVSMNFKYCNTNKKTIKYLNVFWVIKNDVGDVRKTGNFKGTGPVEYWHSGSWDFDHSSYYVAGDASQMFITKVIITYMDGTTKTLTGNNLFFQN